jgi:hypothetical protein
MALQACHRRRQYESLGDFAGYLAGAGGGPAGVLK